MKDKIAGCLLGMAIGDGWGAPVEFLTLAEIQSKWGAAGPLAPEGDPIKVTDDTQMALAFGEALVQTFARPFSLTTLEQNIRQHFIQWLHDPENNRAPGMTCLVSCQKLEQPIPWQQATNTNAKGCGANMRVAPVALAQGLSLAAIGKIAQFQAALTHGHPTALAASELTAVTIVTLLNCTTLTPASFVEELLAYCAAQQDKYHTDVLGNLWEQPMIENEVMFINRGWEACTQVLLRVKNALPLQNQHTDPCLLTGAGWVAEEAFATALLCFLWFPDQPAEALRRAVFTSGDTDSIAALTGAFAGAFCGREQLPADWVDRIEYKESLEALARYFSTHTLHVSSFN